MSTRFFTPALANRTLPLVRKIVEDILTKGKELRRIAGMRSDANHAELERLGNEIRLHIEELSAVGCEYKDWSFDVGVVDFPARIRGRHVYLCWRSDEDRVEFFHGVESGIAGRRRIPHFLLEDGTNLVSKRREAGPRQDSVNEEVEASGDR
ncbi:MAG TPA: DUF2203 domain-containing protein [Planctomycetota bacterium]|nr:DUF2203 domain-containing protein [Planctomycetota bacterium]